MMTNADDEAAIGHLLNVAGSQRSQLLWSQTRHAEEEQQILVASR
jgi:hypothetical protein